MNPVTSFLVLEVPLFLNWKILAQTGKAMVVAMSREICVHLYNEIIKLRPDWHDADPEKGVIRIVMTGSASDKALLRAHIYSSQVKKRMEKRFKDSTDPMRLAIVRDMWLTGFDAPCVHTLYVDKPMKGHNLMRAIARVNRVFKDKQGALVVDYDYSDFLTASHNAVGRCCQPCAGREGGQEALCRYCAGHEQGFHAVLYAG